jgi:hypothetical protein
MLMAAHHALARHGVEDVVRASLTVQTTDRCGVIGLHHRPPISIEQGFSRTDPVNRQTDRPTRMGGNQEGAPVARLDAAGILA